MPRPKSDDARRPTQIRVTDEELDLLERAANSVGMPRSTWMRFELLKLAKQLAPAQVKKKRT